jgi:ferredoxin
VEQPDTAGSTRDKLTHKEYKSLADHVPYVVEDECIACGACEEICPEVFTVNESLGFAQVMNPSGAPTDKIQEAIDACPVQCIHWADEPE